MRGEGEIKGEGEGGGVAYKEGRYNLAKEELQMKIGMVQLRYIIVNGERN